MLLRTPLYDHHLALGAKLVPFAGYEMPIRYAGDTAEHLAVRQQAGLFDVSHMGEFLIKGPKALDLLQTISSNDVSKCPIGKAQYGTIPNHQGGIVDDTIVYHLDEELYMLVVNAANIGKDWAWVNDANRHIGAELEDISAKTALMALSGPAAPAIITQLTAEPVLDLGFYAQLRGTVAGLDNVIVATTGYTGERTFELYCHADHAPKLWEAVMAAGQPHGLQPVGLGARDTLRLEMGYMLYGNDIDDTTLPLEAGLGWVTKLKKGDFIGRGPIAAAKEAGLSRKLIAFRTEGRAIPRQGCTLLDGTDGQTEVGRVTSGSFSPSLKHGIGMGYVALDYATGDKPLAVSVRNAAVPVQVVKLPFVHPTSLSTWLGK